jgi:hypothetical protein
MFFTDCGRPSVTYENTHFIDFTLDDFSRLAKKRIGLDLQFRNPYKLCDLKPAYGDIFAEYIKAYDFWGYGDIDLIYGNLNSYLIEGLLKNFDILSNHPKFITGHLCILRNSPEIVSLYKENGVYKEVFQDPYYTGFDEQLLKRKINLEAGQLQTTMRVHLQKHIRNFSWTSSLSGMVPGVLKRRISRRIGTVVKDFTSIVRHHAEVEGIRVIHVRTFQSDLMLEKRGIRNWSIYWDKGRLISSFNREGILYFHFIMSKLNQSFSVQDFKPGTVRFLLTSSGISRGKG